MQNTVSLEVAQELHDIGWRKHCKSFFGDNIGIIEWHKTNPWIVLRYVDSRNGIYSFDHLSLEAFEIIGNLTDNPDLLTQ